MINEKKLKGILDQLWLDCNNVPDDGTIHDPVGVLQDQAIVDIQKLAELDVDEIRTFIDQCFAVEFMSLDYPKEEYRKKRNELANAICKKNADIYKVEK